MPPPPLVPRHTNHSSPRPRPPPRCSTAPPGLSLTASAPPPGLSLPRSLCIIDSKTHVGFPTRDRMNLLDLGVAVSNLIRERKVRPLARLEMPSLAL